MSPSGASDRTSWQLVELVAGDEVALLGQPRTETRIVRTRLAVDVGDAARRSPPQARRPGPCRRHRRRRPTWPGAMPLVAGAEVAGHGESAAPIAVDVGPARRRPRRGWPSAAARRGATTRPWRPCAADRRRRRPRSTSLPPPWCCCRRAIVQKSVASGVVRVGRGGGAAGHEPMPPRRPAAAAVRWPRRWSRRIGAACRRMGHTESSHARRPSVRRRRYRFARWAGANAALPWTGCPPPSSTRSSTSASGAASSSRRPRSTAASARPTTTARSASSCCAT